MDATDNKALIALSVGGVAGFQFLDLATDTFEPAFTTQDPGGQVSEDPLIDPVHHLIVSAAEDNNYELANEDATELVVVDLTDMLKPAIVPATGNVCDSGTLPSNAVSFIPLP